MHVSVVLVIAYVCFSPVVVSMETYYLLPAPCVDVYDGIAVETEVPVLAPRLVRS